MAHLKFFFLQIMNNLDLVLKAFAADLSPSSKLASGQYCSITVTGPAVLVSTYLFSSLLISFRHSVTDHQPC